MSDLRKQSCVPCTKGSPPLPPEKFATLSEELSGWEIEGGKRLTKTYVFRNYADALNWVNEISEIAEEENHHPDVFLAWGRVRLEVSTHAIGALHQNDFILAAKIDKLEAALRE